MCFRIWLKKAEWIVVVGIISMALGVSGLYSVVQAEDFAGEILLGVDDALTGARASTNAYINKGHGDYWKPLNYQITVGGKKYRVKYLFRDNKTEVSNTVSNFSRFVAEGAVFVNTGYTPGGMALKPLAERAKVPVLSAGYNKILHIPPSKYLYLCQPSYPGVAAAGIKWYKGNRYKGKDKMKVGLLLDDSAFGRAVDIPEFHDYLKEDLGVEFVTVFYPVTARDFTAQLMRLKEAKVDMIFHQGVLYILLPKETKRMGIGEPDIGVMNSMFGLTNTYVEVAGAAAAEGDYGLHQWYLDPAYDSPSFPVVQRLRDSMEKYQGNRYCDTGYVQGWMCMYLMHHIVELAIGKYGYPITGEQVAEAASTMPPWDWGLSRSFSGFSGGDRLGWHETQVYQVKNGKIVRASDWLPEPEEFLRRAPWVLGRDKY